jgi:hypothetical protein
VAQPGIKLVTTPHKNVLDIFRHIRKVGQEVVPYKEGIHTGRRITAYKSIRKLVHQVS